MPRLSEVQRRDRRTQIAEAALRCFARSGFAGTSMADIIAEADSSAGAVYTHFSGKAELLQFAVTSVLDERLDEVERSVRQQPAPPPVDVLRGLLSDFVLDRDAAVLLLQVWSQVPSSPELTGIASGILDRLRTSLTTTLTPWAAKAGADAGSSADLLLAVMHGYVVRTVLAPPSDHESLRNALLESFEATRPAT